MAFPLSGLWLAPKGVDEGGADTARLRDPHSKRSANPALALDALLTRLQADDERALEEMIHAYTDDLVSIAEHYVRHEELAYDIVQDVFIAVWNRRQQIDQRVPLLHYLRRATRNRALNVRARATTAEAGATVLRAEATYGLPETNMGPQSVEREEVHTMVRQAAVAFSPRVREVLLLYYEQGLEPIEIAALLEVSPRTVYAQLNTALRRLAMVLAPWRDASR